MSGRAAELAVPRVNVLVREQRRATQLDARRPSPAPISGSRLSLDSWCSSPKCAIWSLSASRNVYCAVVPRAEQLRRPRPASLSHAAFVSGGHFQSVLAVAREHDAVLRPVGRADRHLLEVLAAQQRRVDQLFQRTPPRTRRGRPSLRRAVERGAVLPPGGQLHGRVERAAPARFSPFGYTSTSFQFSIASFGAGGRERGAEPRPGAGRLQHQVERDFDRLGAFGHGDVERVRVGVVALPRDRLAPAFTRSPACSLIGPTGPCVPGIHFG